jgi:hypothetical protein
MSDLTVIIKGLAFCDPKNTETQVLLPHAPGHELRIIRAIEGGQPNPAQPFPGEKTVTITLENGAVPIDPTPPDKDLINIAHWHDQAHSTLKFRPRNPLPASMRISHLTIPAPEIFSGALSDHDYEIWAHRPSVNPPLRDFVGQPANSHTAEHKLAEEAQAKFRIPAGSAVKVLVNGKLIETFINKAGENYVLTFDNHCRINPCVADFGYYYEMLQGTDNQGRNVELNEFAIRISSESSVPKGDSEAACNPVFGHTQCDLKIWRNGGMECPVTENFTKKQQTPKKTTKREKKPTKKKK